MVETLNGNINVIFANLVSAMTPILIYNFC